MNELKIILEALREVNRDIERMLRAGAKDEKSKKVLNDARVYRKMLEDDALHAAKKAKANGAEIVGVIIVGLN